MTINNKTNKLSAMIKHMVTQKIHNYIAYKSLMKNFPQRWWKTFKMSYIMCSTTLRPQKTKKQN